MPDGILADTSYMASIPDPDLLAQVVAGLTRCHGHHFVVYADNGQILGSRLCVMDCIPKLLNPATDPASEDSEVVQLLARAEAGRREYAEGAPDEQRAILLTEANTLRLAGVIAKGGPQARGVALSLQPSWRWGDETPFREGREPVALGDCKPGCIHMEPHTRSECTTAEEYREVMEAHDGRID